MIYAIIRLFGTFTENYPIRVTYFELYKTSIFFVRYTTDFNPFWLHHNAYTVLHVFVLD